MTLSGATVMAMASVEDCVSAGVEESLTSKVIVALVAALGIPEITPVALASDNPVGRVPLVIDQLYGAVPPLAASVAL